MNRHSVYHPTPQRRRQDDAATYADLQSQLSTAAQPGGGIRLSGAGELLQQIAAWVAG